MIFKSQYDDLSVAA